MGGGTPSPFYSPSAPTAPRFSRLRRLRRLASSVPSLLFPQFKHWLVQLHIISFRKTSMKFMAGRGSYFHKVHVKDLYPIFTYDPGPNRRWHYLMISSECLIRLTYVCLTFVTYMVCRSRTQGPKKTNIGTVVAYVSCESYTIFRIKGSKVRISWPLFSPPY